MTNAAKKHMGRVAELPCAICGTSPVEVHHMLQGRTPGVRSSDWLTMPLCPSCHRDNHNGIHGMRHMWQVMRMDEHDALANTLEKLYGKA